MSQKKRTKHLQFFGIGLILPYLKNVSRLILIMLFFGLLGTVGDIVLPRIRFCQSVKSGLADRKYPTMQKRF